MGKKEKLHNEESEQSPKTPPASPPPDKEDVKQRRDDRPNPSGNKDNEPEEQAAG